MNQNYFSPMCPGHPCHVPINPRLEDLGLLFLGVEFRGEAESDDVRLDGVLVIGKEVVLRVKVVLRSRRLHDTPLLLPHLPGVGNILVIYNVT